MKAKVQPIPRVLRLLKAVYELIVLKNRSSTEGMSARVSKSVRVEQMLYKQTGLAGLCTLQVKLCYKLGLPGSSSPVRTPRKILLTNTRSIQNISPAPVEYRSEGRYCHGASPC